MNRTVDVASVRPDEAVGGGRTRSTFSLRPTPPCEPPFDDEIEPAARVSDHQLAFDWNLTVRSDIATVARSARPPTPTVVLGASADARYAVHRFVRLCVEVLNGHRPAAQLRRLALPREAAGVVAQGLAGAQRMAGQRRPAGPADRRPYRRTPPVAVVRLRLCQPCPAAVEAAVALVTAERTWAMALRLELHDEAWAATALRII